MGQRAVSGETHRDIASAFEGAFGAKAHLLRETLAAGVTLLVWEMRASGGPSEGDFEFLGRFGPILGGQGDSLMFASKGGGWQGDYTPAAVARGGGAGFDTRSYHYSTAQMHTMLCRAVATMAFCPSGVTLLGLTFCAKHSPGGVEAQSAAGRVCRGCADESSRAARPARMGDLTPERRKRAGRQARKRGRRH